MAVTALTIFPAESLGHEGDAIRVTVALADAVAGDFAVVPRLTDGTETGGTDYTENTVATTFAGDAGEENTFTVATTEDAGDTVRPEAEGGDGDLTYSLTPDPPEGLSFAASTRILSGTPTVAGEFPMTSTAAAEAAFTFTIPVLPTPPTARSTANLAPSAPTLTRTRFSEPTAPALDVRWTAPDTGGATITGYKAQYRKKAAAGEDPASWTAYSGTLGATATTFNLSGLEAGATYEAQVLVVTGDTDSPWSATGEGTANRPPTATSTAFNGGTFPVGSIADYRESGQGALGVFFQDADSDALTYAAAAQHPALLGVSLSGAAGDAHLQATLLNQGSSELTFTASDPYGGQVTRTVTIGITANTSRRVAENSPAGTLVGDPVTGTPYNDVALSYSLTGNAVSSGLFEIDSSTGQIKVAAGATLDYETDDSYRETESYSGFVVAKYYSGKVQYTVGGHAAAIDVRIIVTDVGTGAPAAPTLTRTRFSEPTAPALDVRWTAPDTDGATITGYKAQYRKKAAAGEDPASWTAYSGTLGATATTFNLSGLEAGATYEAQVLVVTGDTESSWSATGEGTANRPPTATGTPFNGGTFPVGSILDYRESGQGALGVFFQDADSDALTYAAAAQHPALLGVSLSGAAGDAHLQATLLNQGSSQVTFTASDPYGGQVTRTTTIGITAKRSRRVAENSPAGTLVGDPVTGTPYNDVALSYSLTGNAASSGLFEIDSSTGQIKVAAGATLDYETDDSYRETETFNGQLIAKFYRGKVQYTVDGHAAAIDVSIIVTDVGTGAPAAPTLTRTRFSEPTAPALDVRWTAPDTDGATITGYKAQYRKKAAAGEDPASWTAYSGTLGATATTFNLSGLEAGATYEAQVLVVTGDTESSWSATGEGTANRPPTATGTPFNGGTFPVGSILDYRESGQGALGVFFQDADSDALTYAAAAQHPALLGVSLSGAAGDAHLQATLLNQGSSQLTFTASDPYGGQVTRTTTIGITAKRSRRVAENSPAGTLVGDPVTGTPYNDVALSYSLTGNAASSGLFEIDSSTGQIKVAAGATLDYETDDSYRETETFNGQLIAKFYRGKVQYTVDSHAAAIDVSIIVTDVGTGAPAAPTLTRTRFSEPTAPALDVRWTAPDTDGATITGYKAQYRKKAAAGEDPASWTAYSGTLGATATTFNLSGLEAGATYEAQVLVVTGDTESSWSATGEGTANRPPTATGTPFNGGTFPVGSILDYRESGQGALGVFFQDADSDALTYAAAAQHPALLGVSLSGAAGDAHLQATNLNQGSSQLTFTASDPYGGQVTRTTTIGITAKRSRRVAENSPAGTLVGDPVTGTPYNDVALSYSLTGNAASSGLFEIDSSTGQIKVAAGATLDYETDDSYRETETFNGQLIAKFYRGKVQYTVDSHAAAIDVSIIVTDVGTGAPAAPTLTRTRFSEPTAPALDVRWTAPDTDGATITGYKAQYRKKAAAGEDPASWTAYSGTLGATATTFNLSGLEAGATYEAQVLVVTGDTESSWSATGEGTANRPPTATGTPFNGGTFPVGSILDYRESGQGALGVFFQDADSDALTYAAAAQHPALLGVSLSGAAGDAHLQATNLNQGSSQLTFTASDPYGGQVTRTTTIGITAKRSRRVAENSPAGTLVGDPVTGTPYNDVALSYSLTGNAASSGLFEIESTTGQIKVAAGATLDYETDDSYRETETFNGQLIAKFYRGKVQYTVDSHAAAIDVSIIVTDVGTGAPAAPTLTRTRFSEPTAPALDVRWTAPDTDGATITGYKAQYRKKAAAGEDPASWTAYSGTLGATATTFNLSGLEAGATYEAQVLVVTGDTESSWSATGEGTANRPPTATSTPFNGGTFPVGSIADYRESGQGALGVFFQDADSDALTYAAAAQHPALLGVSLSGAAGDAHLQATNLNQGSSQLTFTASDPYGGQVTRTTTIGITAKRSRRVAENSPAGTLVGDPVTGTPYNDVALSYSLTGNAASSGLFEIESTTGQIKVAAGATLDYETDDSYRETETFNGQLIAKFYRGKVQYTVDGHAAAIDVSIILTKVASTGIALTVSPTSVDEDASATTVTVTATLNEAPRTSATPVAVAVGATDDTATEGTDYATVAGLSMSIAAGNTVDTLTFTLTPTDDEVVEGDEAISVSGTTTVTGLTVTDAEVTLTDDDGSAEVTVGDASAAEGDSIAFTVTLDKAVQDGLTVTPSFTNGTAASTDYTENTAALSFTGTANETQSFKVATTEDALVEGNETFTVGLAVSGTEAPVTATDTGTGTINNDDTASTGIALTVSPTSVDEDASATTVTVTATLNEAPRTSATPVAVAVGATDDTATEGTDYATVAGLSMSIAAGNTVDTLTFTLTPTDDEVVEGDEAISVAGTTTVTGLTVTDAEVTLTDDDGSAEVTVGDASAAEGDSIAFTVTLDKAVQDGLTVTPSFTNGTAASTDYTENTAALSFTGTAGETQDFRVATTEDALVEGNETFTVGLAVSGTEAPVTATDTGTGTINNDDTASTGIALTVSPTSVAEDASATTVTVTATLNEAPRTSATPVAVAVGATDDTATEGTDYATVAGLSMSIAAGNTADTLTFTLTPTDDEVVEGDEAISVSGTTTVTGLTVTDAEVTLTDDDGSAEVTVGDASAAEGDSIAFTVTLDKAVQDGLTVTPSFTNGTAASTDYTENTAALSFTGTAGETQDFRVATTEDALVEGNETFTVGLAVSGTEAPVTATDTGTGTINNDDTASTGIALTVSPTSVAEDASATTVTVTATLNDAPRTSATPVAVAVGATDDTATEGTDYATVAGLSMSIAAGNTADTLTFTLTPTDDEVVEGDEAISVSGTTTVTGLTVTDAEVTLTDDDGSAEVTVADASAAEGDSIAFTVTLDKAVQDGLTVTPSFTNGTAASTDYTENTAALSFTGTANETQSFKVATTEDALVEGNETFTVGLAVSGTEAPVTATDTGTGTINNDDTASTGIALTVSPTSVDEDASATTVTVTATLNEAPRTSATPVAVAVGATDDTATEGTDYATVAGLSMSIAAGNTADTLTFTLTPTDDEVVEGDEAISVAGTTTVTGLTVTDTEVTLTDDDGSAEVTVGDASAAEGDSIAFTVTLDKAVQDGLTVTPSFTNGTAASTDYTENTAALSFTGTAGETQDFRVATTEDALVEGNETFTVGLAVSGTEAPVTATDTGTGTINNDDTASTGIALTVSPTSVAEDASATTVTVTATLNEAPRTSATPVAVAVGATDDTATEGTDYATVAGLSMSIAAGNTADTLTFTLTPTDDEVVEGDEAISVSGTTTVTGLTVTDAEVTLTDDDGSAEVTVGDASAAEGDSIAFTVTLDKAVQDGLTVTPSFTNGTAASTDYTENTAALSFTGTAGETQDFRVATTEDALVEGNETFTVGLAVSGTEAPVTATDTGTGTINNDDTASTGIALTVSPTSVAEDASATTVTVTATLNDAPRTSATPVAVAVGATDDTATEGTDYATVAGLSMSIAAGNTADTTTFTLTPTDDEVVEGDEAISVSGTTTVTGLTVTDAEVTLTDDDGSAEVTVADASAAEGDSIAFTVTLDKAVQDGLTVTPSFTNGTAASTDYTENTAALSFTGTANETQSFKVATTEDALVEGNETFTVGLAVSGTEAPVTATDTGTGTINNDDTASTGIALTVSPTSVDEDASATTVTVTATLNEAPRTSATPVAVAVGATDDTATEGTDYATVAGLSMSIAAGNTADTLTFTLTPTDDEVVEGDEAISVAGTTTVTGLTVTDTEVTLTDDDGSAEVTVADASAAEGDSIAFTVTLDKAVQDGLTVTPSFTNGTAASTDYTENTAALSFTGTANETQSFKVATTEDALVEGNETFTVGLAVSGTEAPVTATDTATGTINNDDAASRELLLSVGVLSDPVAPTTTVTGVTSVAENASPTTVAVTVELDDASRAAATPVTVVVGATGDAATEGTDYATVADLSMLIAAGNTADTTTFTLTPTDDEVVEGDETLSVSGTTTVTELKVTETKVTIIDDDGSAKVTIADASAAEGDSIAFTVTLDKAVQGGLTVTPGFTDGTATKGTDYTENTGALTFTGTADETQSFKVATTEDALIEEDETFTVSLAVSGTEAPVTATDTATGTINNDDAASTGIVLSVSPGSVDEDASATTVTVTATLDDASRAAATPVTVVVGATGDAATEGTDYATVADLSMSIAAGNTADTTTFTLTPTDDEVVEGDETLSVAGTTTVTKLTVTDTEVTLTDDDGSAEVTIADASAAEGDTITFTVTLDKAVQGGLTVTPSFTDGTATAGTDYTANTTAIAFAGTAGETQDFRVATTEDALIEEDETFTVSLAVSGTEVPVTATDTATGTINNDDAASTGIVLSVTPGSVDEDASATTVTVTATLDDASRAAATPVTVVVGATGDAATEGTDYATVADLSMSIAAGNTADTTTFTLTPTDDEVVEGDETLSVAGTTTVTELTVTDTEVTITDDDGSAEVTIADASATEGEVITFTVTLDKAVQGGFTVTPSFTDGTATAGTDYTTNTAAIAFTGTAGEQHTFTVSTAEDADPEPDETFTVSLSVSGTQETVTATDTATGTITDDDTPSVTIEDAAADEGDAITFTVTLDKVVQDGLTVTPSFTDGTATAGADYTANTAAIAFTGTAGEQHTFTVSTAEDADPEPDETFTVSLSVSGTQVTVRATDTAMGTIIDDETPSVTIEDAAADEGEAITFRVTLDKAVSGGLTVTPGFTDGTATAGTDYAANTAAITFAGTAGERHTFTVSTAEDADPEPDETFTVSLSVSGTQETVTATDTATGTIIDDDTPSVTIRDASAAEGNSITFTVTLGMAVQGGLIVTPRFTDGTATKGTDYTENTTAITFAGTAGERHTFTVATTEDTDQEPDETFTVSLSVSGTQETVRATDTATGTITDDDTPSVTIGDALAAEGDSITFTVTLSMAVQGGLIVTPRFTDGTATAGTDYTANTAAIAFTGTAGEQHTFTVATIEDTDPERDETFTVSLSVSGTQETVSATDTGTGTITDDDGKSDTTPAVTIGDASADEGDAITFTVTLDKAVFGGLTVTPRFTDGTATAGTDYTANTAAIAFEGTAGEQHTLTVATIEDTDREPDETFTVSLSVSGTQQAVTATDTAIGTITDDEPGPSDTAAGGSAQLVIRLEPNVVSESSGPTLVTVVAELVGATTQKALPVTMMVGGSDDTAELSVDYDANDVVTMTIPAGSTQERGTFMLLPIEDDRIEGSEILTVTGESRLNAASAQVTIRDDNLVEARVEGTGRTLFLLARAIGSESLAAIEERFATGRSGRRTRLGAVSSLTSRMQGGWEGLITGIANPAASLGMPNAASVGGALGNAADPRGEVGAPTPSVPSLALGMPAQHQAFGKLGWLDGVSFATQLGHRSATAEGSADTASDDAGWMLWGRTATTRMAVQAAPSAQQANGDIFTMHMGVDTRVGSRVLLGVAVSHNRGKLGYALGAERSASLAAVDGGLTSAQPYLHWTPRSGLEVWSLGGLGRGTLKTSDTFGTVDTGIGMRLAGGGVRQEATAGGGVAVKADAFHAVLTSEAQDDLPSARATATRGRLLIELASEWAPSQSALVQPRVEFGGRWDGGSDVGGMGAELGGGLSLVHAGLGLELTGAGRYLLAHQAEGFEEWGASVTLRAGPGVADQGPWVSIEPELGAAASRTQALWGPQPGSGFRSGASVGPRPARWRLSTGYALPQSGVDLRMDAIRETRDPEAGLGIGLQLSATLEW